jgi:hypothetical protein
MIGSCGIEARADFCATCPHSACIARLTGQVKKSKYNVAREGQRTYRGIVFRSKLEADYACHLDLLGIRWEYETVKLTYWSKETPTRPRHLLTKLIDFKVLVNDAWELHECKGCLAKGEKHKLRQLAMAIKENRVLGHQVSGRDQLKPQVYILTKPDIATAMTLENYLKSKVDSKAKPATI